MKHGLSSRKEDVTIEDSISHQLRIQNGTGYLCCTRCSCAQTKATSQLEQATASIMVDTVTKATATREIVEPSSQREVYESDNIAEHTENMDKGRQRGGMAKNKWILNGRRRIWKEHKSI